MERAGKAMTFGEIAKGIGSLIALLLIIGWCWLMYLVFMTDYFSVADNQITESEALVLCQGAYDALSKYDADIGMSDPYTVFKTDAGWVLKIEGRLQNGFGAWLKVMAHCEVPFERRYERFDTRNVANFEYLSYD